MGKVCLWVCDLMCNGSVCGGEGGLNDWREVLGSNDEVGCGFCGMGVWWGGCVCCIGMDLVWFCLTSYFGGGDYDYALSWGVVALGMGDDGGCLYLCLERGGGRFVGS